MFTQFIKLHRNFIVCEQAVPKRLNLTVNLTYLCSPGERGGGCTLTHSMFAFCYMMDNGAEKEKSTTIYVQCL